MDTDNTLFDRLGGIRKMAELLGEPPSTVQSWKGAGRIPSQKQPLVMDKAKAAGIEVTAEDVVYPMGPPKPCASDRTHGAESAINDELPSDAEAA